MNAVLSWLFGKRPPKDAPPKEEPCTPEQASQIWADCWAADAHEDELFYAYQAVCRAQGREFDFGGFFKYAGENWRLELDAYGYRKAFLSGEPHPSATYLDGLEKKTP